MLSVVSAFAQDIVTTETNRNKKLTVTISGYPTSPTKKVSGTNESFSVNVNISEVAYSPASQKWNLAYIESLKIYIGDELIKECGSTVDDPCASYSYGVKWDTTHFTHGTTKDIKVEAKMKVRKGAFSVDPPPAPQVPVWHDFINPDDETLEPSVPVSIYNRGWTGAISSRVSYGAYIHARNAYGSTHHDINDAGSVDISECLGGLGYATVFYLHSHGDADGTFYNELGQDFWMVYPSWPSILLPYQPNVRNQRQSASNEGLPRMNIAYLDCCLVGLTNVTALEFLESPDALVNGIPLWIDRSFLSWKILSYTCWKEPFCSVFWPSLANGDTIGEAVDQSYSHLVTLSQQQSNFPAPGNKSDILGLYGDGTTRMYGLYTGSTTKESTWYKVQ